MLIRINYYNNCAIMTKIKETTDSENKEKKEIEKLSESDNENDIKDENLSAGLSSQAGLPEQTDEEAEDID